MTSTPTRTGRCPACGRTLALRAADGLIKWHGRVQSTAEYSRPWDGCDGSLAEPHQPKAQEDRA